MKQIKMPDLHVRIYGMTKSTQQIITVDGGWMLHIPEVARWTDETMHVYSEAWVDSIGSNPWELEQKVKEILQKPVTRITRADGGRAIAYYLRKYVKLYHTSQGFNPELAARLRVPGENVGRRGKAYARIALKEMYESRNGG